MDILQHFEIKDSNSGVCCRDQWMTDSGAQQFETINPTTQTCLAKVSYATASQYQEVMSQAEEVARYWRQVPAPKRGELIRQLAQALREEKDYLGTLITMEMGKSKAEGDGEVQEMIDIADFAVGQSRMLYGKTMHSEREQHRMYEQWHPLGIVGVITAFNFPAAVWAWNACLAAVCGNVVVWKPSSKTPLVAVAIQKICQRVLANAGYPGVFMLLTCNDELAKQFVDDKRVALVSFTGSTAVGRKVGAQVAERLGKSLLELGGNNAMIIDATANLQLAVPAIVFGAVGTAGQRCTTTRRVFVQRDIAEQLIKQLVKAYKQVRIGDPLDKTKLMGPLIDQQAVDTFNDAIQQIKQQGGEILFGGKALDGIGYFVEPTLVRAENHWDIVQQETFAPILYIMVYDELDEAILQHNAVSQGLSSAIFTQDIRMAETFLSAVGSDCGIANVNIGTSGAEIGGAFGGEKDTGGGRESGSDAWKAYMRRQTNTINWSQELPLAQGIKFEL